MVDTVREPLIVLDKDLRIIAASRSFYVKFATNPDDSQRQHLYELGNGEWDIPGLQELLENIIPSPLLSLGLMTHALKHTNFALGVSLLGCSSRTNAEGRPTQRFFNILLGQSVALGEDAYHFRHVLGSPSTQRDDRVGQAAAERGKRVVDARRHLFVVGPRQHAIGLQYLQLLDQHLVADALDRALELAVALGPSSRKYRICGFHLPEMTRNVAASPWEKRPPQVSEQLVIFHTYQKVHTCPQVSIPQLPCNATRTKDA
jgi:hypothetical protein